MEFRFRHCPECHFRAVENPSVETTSTGSIATGNPPMPSAPIVLRDIEWILRRFHQSRGILKTIGSIIPIRAETQWLDYGCGRGGLLKYVRGHSPCRPVGFDDSWFGAHGLKNGAPILSRADLKPFKGAFDVVTCIDVLQECRDPLTVLKDIRSFLKPGGLFFYTADNAAPFRKNFVKWSEVVPETTLSYFEPQTMQRALHTAGFRANFRGALPGLSDIIRFKLTRDRSYRTLPVPAFPENYVPWKAVSWLADKRYKYSAFPIGWAI